MSDTLDPMSGLQFYFNDLAIAQNELRKHRAKLWQIPIPDFTSYEKVRLRDLLLDIEVATNGIERMLEQMQDVPPRPWYQRIFNRK